MIFTQNYACSNYTVIWGPWTNFNWPGTPTLHGKNSEFGAQEISLILSSVLELVHSESKRFHSTIWAIKNPLQTHEDRLLFCKLSISSVWILSALIAGFPFGFGHVLWNSFITKLSLLYNVDVPPKKSRSGQWANTAHLPLEWPRVKLEILV